MALVTASDVASGQAGGLGALTMLAFAYGVPIAGRYVDDESAFDGPVAGSAMVRILADARRRKFNEVIVSELASLGTGMIEALANLDALRRCGVSVHVATMGPITAIDLIGMPL